MCCGGVLRYHVQEERTVQNLVCAPKMGSSLLDSPDQTRASMTVTCRCWEELMCPAPGILLGQVTLALSQVQLQPSFPVSGAGPLAAQSCLAVTNVYK